MADVTPLFAGLDANAMVAHMATRAVGPLATAAAQDHAGKCFHEFMCGLGLASPATFVQASGSPRGPPGAWKSNAGRWHTLDYIMAPDSRTQAVCEARTLPVHTLALAGRVYHAAPLAAFRLHRAKAGRAGVPAPPMADAEEPAATRLRAGMTCPYGELPSSGLLPPITRVASREHLRSVAVAEAVIADWEAAPPMPDDWHHDLMKKALASFSRHVFVARCPRSAPARRIDEPTWCALKQHATARGAFFAELKERRRVYLRCAFSGWRAASGRVAASPASCCAAPLAEAMVGSAPRVARACAGLTGPAAAARKAVAASRSRWLDAQAEQAAAKADDGDYTPVWQLVRRLLGKSARPQGAAPPSRRSWAPTALWPPMELQSPRNGAAGSSRSTLPASAGSPRRFAPPPFGAGTTAGAARGAWLAHDERQEALAKALAAGCSMPCRHYN